MTALCESLLAHAATDDTGALPPALAEQRRDLGDRQPLAVAQDQRRALFGRQVGERAHQVHQPLVLDHRRRRDRRRRAVATLDDRVVDRRRVAAQHRVVVTIGPRPFEAAEQLLPQPAPPQHPQAHRRDDAAQPRRRRRRIAQLADAFAGPGQGFLHRFFGFGAIAE